jgi:hypothetical protein
MAGMKHLTADTEILNGEVTGKEQVSVSCSHSYDCNCQKTCDSKGSCSESCDTCYDHFQDYDWTVSSTAGDLDIDRVDRQGAEDPERFTKVKVGDPVARSNSFDNYVKAVPESLFNFAASKELVSRFAGKLPGYPGSVYDYHYVDRVIAQGVAVPELAAWNRELSLRLRKLGVARQVNIVMVFTKERDPDYANALQASWLGAKKNDVVLVFGVTAWPKPDWVRVFAWTDNELFKVELRDSLGRLSALDRNQVMDIIQTKVEKGFKRKPMSDYAYLKDEISPPGWVIALAVVAGLLSSILLSVVFSRRDTLPGGFRTRFRPYTRAGSRRF